MPANSSQKPFRLLHIDGDPKSRDLIQLANDRAEKQFEVYSADGARSATPYFAFDAASAGFNPFPRPAIILLGDGLGPHTGADFLFWLRIMRRMTAIPVVMYSNAADPERVAECYQAGANHFVRHPSSFGAVQAFVGALHTCMSIHPRHFWWLQRLAEYEPDPR